MLERWRRMAQEKRFMRRTIEYGMCGRPTEHTKTDFARPHHKIWPHRPLKPQNFLNIAGIKTQIFVLQFGCFEEHFKFLIVRIGVEFVEILDSGTLGGPVAPMASRGNRPGECPFRGPQISHRNNFGAAGPILITKKP
jgi:hypothetical protein